MVISGDFKVKGLIGNDCLYQYVQELRAKGHFCDEAMKCLFKIFENFHWWQIDKKLIVQVSSSLLKKDQLYIDQQNKISFRNHYSAQIFSVMVRASMWVHMYEKIESPEVFKRELAIIFAILIADSQFR